MRIVRRVFGVLFLLGGLFLAFVAYNVAGGMHGWNEFDPGRLFTDHNECWKFSTGALALLLVGVIMTFKRGRLTPGPSH